MKALFALAQEEAGPQPRRADFPTTEAYHHAWYHWRAIVRDTTLTHAELDARMSAYAWRLGVPHQPLWSSR